MPFQDKLWRLSRARAVEWSDDELAVLCRLRRYSPPLASALELRLRLGHLDYGPWSRDDKRSWRREAQDELADALIYLAFARVAGRGRWPGLESQLARAWARLGGHDGR